MIRHTFKEASLLLAVSLLAAGISYTVRSDVPRLLTATKAPVLQAPAAMPTAPIPLTAQQTHDAFNREGVVFVDSRDSFDYDMGHIAGAVSIPLHEAEADPAVLDALPRKSHLVVYCSNELCAKAQKLAVLLNERGFHADTFPGGYQEWTTNDWPTKEGF